MIPNFSELANAIRALTIDAIEKSRSGHPGLPLGMADVATVLFAKHLKFYAKDPLWVNRDRFVLSAGHGSMLLYSLLYLTGYRVSLDDLKNFRQWGSKTPGHPEFGHTEGVETTTGPLGQGLANAVGMALSESILRSRLGADAIHHHTYALVGDGCLMEGISQEAISLAGHLKLSNLIVLFDNNGITIDGSTALSTSENHLKRFEACHWEVISINGHSFSDIDQALEKAKSSSRPVLIACKTIIGYGSPHKSGTEKAHGSPLGPEEALKTKEALGWHHAPFCVPDDLLNEWRSFGQRHKETYENWVKTQQKKLDAPLLPKDLSEKIQTLCEKIKTTQPCIATRKSSQLVLEEIAKSFPALLGGSCDLTPSNNTLVSSMQPITPKNHSGNYIYYGIREHAMAAIMNGLALSGHFVPYGGTFLVFSDYCRPAIRLSALMQQRVIYVMTHDSIGLGEDGPTHQPIEQLPSLRCIPNLHVFRPADTIETAECWELALKNSKTPSILALSRQDLPTLRTDITENFCQKGGYVLDNQPHARLTLIATGSEVSRAQEIQKKLIQDFSCPARLVSMPCVELFAQQSKSYQQEVLGSGLRVFIEAAGPQTWYPYARETDLIFGMHGFGASAPAQDLFEQFGFTTDKIFSKIRQHLTGDAHEKN